MMQVHSKVSTTVRTTISELNPFLISFLEAKISNIMSFVSNAATLLYNDVACFLPREYVDAYHVAEYGENPKHQYEDARPKVAASNLKQVIFS